MKQKTITTYKTTVLLVELPYNATSPKYVDEGHGARLVCNNTSTANGSILVHIPQGKWQLLGRLPDITESQASEVVDSTDYDESRKLYTNYVNKRWTAFALNSLSSLLQANEVCFENKYAQTLQEAVNKSPSDDYESKLLEADIFREAQSKVWDKERCYLFIKAD